MNEICLFCSRYDASEEICLFHKREVEQDDFCSQFTKA